MGTKNGYEQTSGIMLERTKHVVTFDSSTTTEKLMQYLANVPKFATVDEVLIFHDDDDPDGMGPCFTTIEFTYDRRVIT